MSPTDLRRRGRLALLVAVAASVLPAAAAPAAEAALADELRSAMRSAGGASGAYVVNATTGQPVFRFNHMRARILASNTKLFTTAAALARYGTDGRLNTNVRGKGTLGPGGTYRGNLYLVGGGDPTFGSTSFTRSAYGGRGSTVEDLAAKLRDVGIRRVTGRIYGDESRFDARRGGPDSGYGTSIYVGPLSALSYNRGLASETGRGGFQGNPPVSAAAALDRALERRGITVRRAPREAQAPRDSERLAVVQSPQMRRLAALTNKPSDNFFAETLVKDLALQANGRGTTAAGARLAAGYAGRLGAAPASLVDGSGLSRGNRASPASVVRLLMELRDEPGWNVFARSLAVAGRDGTLGSRMRGGPARGRCRGKTGTLSGVSALSGYCRARSGDLYAFSVLNNSVNSFSARAAQDRIAQALAGVR